MIDADLLRRDFANTAQNLQRRGLTLNADEFMHLESRRKTTQQTTETMRARRNQISRARGDSDNVKSGDKPRSSDASEFKLQLQQAEREMNEARAQMEDYLLQLPNILHESVPEGANESANVEIRRWGTPPDFDFAPLDHVALGKQLRMMDFDSAAAMAASRFVVLSSQLSQLHRALAQFMLDLHVQEHGYTEYYMPQLANSDAMLGAGQFPKFVGEVFAAERDGLYLIPTAEVVLVNMARGRVFVAADLPLRLVAHTACFRREAGSYGQDTRGMLRQHQFDKVELVQICAPADSESALEEMSAHAERVLQCLELPYRVVTLCGGDTGFAAAKTYDLEVWLPGQKRYREISSCSNCTAFQARRLKARYRPVVGGKTDYAHTLNGSGVAVGRAFIAVLENHQQADGSVRIPPPLRPYMRGCEQIVGH